MSNILVFRIHRKNPTNSVLNNLSIIIKDLVTDDIISYPTPAFQPSPGSTNIVTTVIKLNETSQIFANSVSVRVIVKVGTQVRYDKAVYNMVIQNVPNLPLLADYPNLTPSTFIALAPTTIPSNPNLISLTPSGRIPKYSELESKCNSVASTLGLTFPNISFIESKDIAAEIMLSRQMNPIMDPFVLVSVSLIDLYNPSNVYISERQQWETSINSNNDISYPVDLDRMAGYVYALAMAKKSKDISYAKTKARIEVPTGVTEPNNAPLSSMNILVDYTDFPNFIDILPEVFYVLGAGLSETIDAEERIEQAISIPEEGIKNLLLAAGSSISLSAIEIYQQSRRIKALNISGSAFPCKLESGNQNVINEWLSTTEENIQDFWDSYTFSTDHLRLIVGALLHHYKYGETLTITGVTNDLVPQNEEFWTNLLLPTILSSTSQTQLLNTIKRYFDINAVVADVPTVPDGTLPSLSIGDNDPFSLFISCYDKLNEKPFSFNPPSNISNITNALQCAFPDDECAQQWVKDKINTLVYLTYIVADLSIEDDEKEEEVKFSIMEALYAQGFINENSIKSVSSGSFQSAFIGTVVGPYASSIYNKAIGSNQRFNNTNDNILLIFLSTISCIPKENLEQVLSILNENGINNPGDIAETDFTEFLGFFEGSEVSRECIIEIYNQASNDDDQDPPKPEEFFMPINPNDSLVNCIPPKELSPLGAIAYLHELVKLDVDSTCEIPFPIKGPAEPASDSTILELLEPRIGNLGILEVSEPNLCTPIPAIDMAIERMEAMVTGDVSIVQSTPIIKTGPDDDLEMGHYLSYEGHETDGINRYHHDPKVFFEAVPAHSSPESNDAYDVLKNTFNDCHLPYHQALDVSSAYLNELGCSRYDLTRKFRKTIHEFVHDPSNPPADFPSHISHYPITLDLALEYLGISTEEYIKVFSYNFSEEQEKPDFPLLELYGFDPNTSMDAFFSTMSNLCEFLKRTCLSYCEFKELISISFLNISIRNQNELPDCAPCDCKEYILDFGINPEEILIKLAIIIKLFKKLNTHATINYCIEEIGLIYEIFSVIPNSDFVKEFAAFQLIREQYDNNEHGKLPFEEEIAKNIHILILWVRDTRNWEWAVDHLLDQIRLKSPQANDCGCRPPSFKKILSANLDQLSVLAGFDPIVPQLTWYAKPTSTLKFAEVISKICASDFQIDEILFLFSNNSDFAGGHPFSLQTKTEAKEFPFDLPGTESSLTQETLRNKLIQIDDISEHEKQFYTWSKIYSILTEEYGYHTSPVNHLQSVGNHFFANTLTVEGLTVTTVDRQYRSSLVTTSAMMWNTGNNSENPFLYDSGSSELFVTVPIMDKNVITKLSRIKQLTDDEQTAVKQCYYAPRVDLAKIGFIFSNFNEAQDYLVNESEETNRWAYFQKEFVLFYKASKIIAQHICDHVSEVMCKPKSESTDLAWLILKSIVAADNHAISAWEIDNGIEPGLTWEKLNGGAFSALFDLRGTGLEGTYKDLNGEVIWREFRGGMTAFGPEENNADTPLPTIISNLDLINSFVPNNPRFASIRNGFAIQNSNGDLLGGAEGYDVTWQGVLYIDETNIYTFRAGSPTPGNEIPDSSAVEHTQYSMILQRSSQMIEVLSNNDDNIHAPKDCSTPIKLKKGAYDITIRFKQPQPTLESPEEGCPHKTGFQIKWQYGYRDLHTIPIHNLYTRSKAYIGKENSISGPTLGHNITTQPGNPIEYLNSQYHASIFGFRATYQQVFKALLFAKRFALSAEILHGEFQSELGHFLTHPISFAGQSYYKNPNWTTHIVGFNFNFLPYHDTYYVVDFNEDNRVAPTLKRIQAMFDWWIRLFDYTNLRINTLKNKEATVWRLFKEATEKHTDPAGDFLYHLGVDFNHINIVSQYLNINSGVESIYDLTASDMETERWAIRVFEAEMCIQKSKCNFFTADIRKAKPVLWSSVDPSKSVGDETYSGNQHLMQFVRMGLIENDSPKDYRRLKKLNDGIRERSRAALIAFLTHNTTIELNDVKISTPELLSEYLLLDVSAGICQKVSRVEQSIFCIQSFINRAQLGLEPSFTISEPFRKLWKKRFSAYQKWSNCKEKELYAENWIEFEKLEEARKSEAFRYLESNLQTQTLSVPVSGGLTLLDTVKPPSHHGIELLQKREPSIMQYTGRDNMLLGSPESSSQPTWLSKIEQEKMPYWFEAAINMQLSFVRVAAASVPPAGITFDCMSAACCAECGDIHDPVMDEYYFWLINSEYYGKVTQDANWDWDVEEQLPTLLFMKNEKSTYLAWTKIHNGQIGQLRWSSKAVAVKTGEIPTLNFQHRDEDFLLFEVENGLVPIGVPTPPNPGFRYDIPTDTAVALPALGELDSSSFDYYGLTSYPYFIYYSPGFPITPVSTYNTSLLVADNLIQHCNFEDALQWLEVEAKPLITDNYWFQNWFDGKVEKQSVLLKYLTILSQWSKALLRIQSKEAINQSNLVIELAKKILGNCPKTVFLTSNVDEIKTLNSYSPAKPPINPRLLCLYNEIYDTDHRIQECINLFGLSPCENVDPCIGVRTGCNSTKLPCIDETIWCLPESPYRFQYLHSKALEYCNVLSGLGGALLSAYEKGDAEYLASLRETQSRQLLDLSLEIRQNQYRAADFDVQALEKTLHLTENVRLVYYQNLVAVGLISLEELYETYMYASMAARIAAQAFDTTAKGETLAIDIWTGTVGIDPVYIQQTPGIGNKGASTAGYGSRLKNAIADETSTFASLSLTQAGWERREQEWLHQIDVLNVEIEIQTRQLRAAERRRDVAFRELNNHALQLTHAQQTHDFLRDKFSNAELYQWLKKETSALYYQMYECTLQIAYQAQKSYNFECDLSNDNFLDIPIWDHLHKGLLSGERIQMALRRMEKSYMDKNFRQYELSKHISLKQHAPFEFLKLKESGKCVISLPESLFNQDYPSHYLRRIKSVSLTIPCIVGPYVGVHCKLTLISNKTRIKPILICGSDDCCECNDSGYNEIAGDTRFRNRYGAKDAIATSTGQNESGMFELNFRDERYLHFEYEGVISNWCIELPLENNYFDMHSVADVVMHINYIAKEGGEILGRAAKSDCIHYLPGDGKKIFDLKSDFSNQWHEMKSKLYESGEKRFSLELGRMHFPFIPIKHNLILNGIDLFFETCASDLCTNFEVGFLLSETHCHKPENNCDIMYFTCIKKLDFGCLYHGHLSLDGLVIKKDISKIGQFVFSKEFPCIERMYLIGDFGIERLEMCGDEKTGNKNCSC